MIETLAYVGRGSRETFRYVFKLRPLTEPLGVDD